MSQIAFALLDLRRVFHVALAATVIAMVHLYGSPSARVQVDLYVVTPILNATEALGRQVPSGTAALRSATKYFGWD